MLDVLKIYRAFNVPHKTKGHKHCRPGWVQVPCPFCSGNPGFHLGFCYGPGQFNGKFVCYRCGGKSAKNVLAKLLRLPANEVNKVMREHGGGSNYGPSIDEKVTVRRKTFKYPARTGDLLPHHAKYLKRRGFDPEKLRKRWRLMSTGPLAPLKVNKEKTLDYSHRIIIPIMWKGKVVSFQGRDVTGRHALKYMACPQELEIIEHKTILYGRAPGKRCLLEEGVTDIWRMGFGALCCFGIKYRLAQIKLLTRYDEIFILFDPEPQAQQQAEKIKAELLFRGVKNVWLPKDSGSPLPLLDHDPGDMDQDDADHLMKDLGLWRNR